MRLDDARALVTGAAGGLGGASAAALARHGVELVLTDRRAARLLQVADSVGAHAALPGDLTVRAELDRVVSCAGRIDVLVAGAGLPAAGELTTFTREQAERAVAVNLLAPIELARRLAPGMTARGRGHIVLLGSVAARVPLPATPLYNATKYGLRGLATTLRQDMRHHGVGVSLVSPGLVSGAGMWAETGLDPPPLVGTSGPEAVGAAVVRSIVRNRGEIIVAPAFVRLGTLLAGMAPRQVAAITSRFGTKTSRDAARAMARKR